MPSNRRQTTPRTVEGTVGEFLGQLVPSLSAKLGNPPHWPPDAYAVAASIVYVTGGYSCLLGDWPPPGQRLIGR